MNLLRLCRYLYSKRILRECVLLFQLICMIVFAFCVLNPIDTFLQKKAALSDTFQLDFSKTLHFSSGNALMQNKIEGDMSMEPQLFDIISSTPEVERVLRIHLGHATCKTELSETLNSNFIIYSEAMSGFIHLPLSREENYLSVLVSASLAKKLPVGSHTELLLGSDLKSIPCVISGILDKDSAIPTILNYGSSPGIGVFGFFPKEMSGENFIAAEYNEDLLKEIDWEMNYLICPEKNSDTEFLLKNLNESVGTYGTVRTMEQIIQQAFSEMLRDNRWYVFAFALLGIIAAFGYGGYLFLMIRQRQTEFAVFYILGMTRRQTAAILFLAGGNLLALALLIGGSIAPWFIQNVLLEAQAAPGVFSLLFCGILLLLILAVSIAAGFRQSEKFTTIALYQEGD